MDGALLLDKPLGLSSNAALQRAKKLCGAHKAGHAGTLDPLASGLLLVLFGEATKFAGPLLDADKEYLATLKLGERTSTGDAEGEIIERAGVQVSESALREVLGRFRGPIVQVPPMYSALKKDGVPLYKLARKGEEVERQPRRVEILELDAVRFEPPVLDLRVRCSKGTYVRVLAEDIGVALGTVAHLGALRRVASGGFHVRDGIGLQELEACSMEERRARLLPLSALLTGLPRADLEAPAEARFRNGQKLPVPGLAEGLCAVYGPAGDVVGLGMADAAGVVRPLRLTAEKPQHHASG